MPQLKLAAILPHSNIDRAVGEIQDTIFTCFGLASALALPVMIPLRILSPDTNPSSFHSLLENQPRSLTVQSSTYRIVDKSLFLSTSLSTEENLDVNFPSPVDYQKRDYPKLFPVREGFFLCSQEQGVPLEKVLSRLDPPPSLCFKPLGYALIAVETSDLPEWWSQTQWEIESLIKCRRS